MRWIAIIAVSLLAGFGGAAAWDYSGLGGGATRAYLLDNPEVLPEAIDVLQSRETAQRLAPMRSEIEAEFPGAVLGNPDGAITLVEFSDYACGYCRQSVADVMQVVKDNPDLKVVVREYPILSEGSANAAMMALAAADQGRYRQFHDAMFAQGSVAAENIAAAAIEAGVDMDRAKADIGSGKYQQQLQNNMFLGQQLGVSGTPAFIVGDKVLQGAVGAGQIQAAIAEARDS